MDRKAAILYPGEMGGAVGKALVDGGWAVASCLEGRSSRTVAAAQAAGITPESTLEAAVAVADLVVSVVPQTAVIETAAAFAAAVGGTDRRPVYLDANSVAPATVAEVRTIVEAAGCDCVDGAFLGSAGALGRKTTLYLSGGPAREIGSLLGDALKCVVVNGDVGVASAFKLAFAGFNKGLVALFLEVMAAADRLEQRDALLECLREFYPGTVETVARLLPSYPRHAARRAEEMDELVSSLRAQGSEPVMAAGAAAVLARFAALHLNAGADWDLETVLEAWSRADSLRDEAAPG